MFLPSSLISNKWRYFEVFSFIFEQMALKCILGSSIDCCSIFDGKMFYFGQPISAMCYI